MASKLILVVSVSFLVQSCSSEPSSGLDVIKSGIADWLECSVESSPADCLEVRTTRQLHELTYGIKQEIYQSVAQTRRLGKKFKDDSASEEEMKEVQKLEAENDQLIEKIRGRETESNGMIDEISDLFTYGFTKLLGYFSPEKQTEEDLNEKILLEADEARGNEVEGRGKKKYYLKKQNKHLKIILLLMLFKNKVKMFVHKAQFLLQLKFLGIAVINLLVNLVRLWLELKKHHKPHKVVYYENAHHQHHYDHEHLHDHDDGHYSHPGSHSHHSHHEEEYGGSPWPWSRSYIEKQSEQVFQNLNQYNRPNNAGSHNLVYLKQRPLRR